MFLKYKSLFLSLLNVKYTRILVHIIIIIKYMLERLTHRVLIFPRNFIIYLEKQQTVQCALVLYLH